MHLLPQSLPFTMLIVFGSAKLMSELFERLRMPGIVGQIVAGVLIGPSLLGWIVPNDALRAFSDLGVLFLLFDIGLDAKVSEFMKVGLMATVVAAMGELLPFVAIWGLLLLWGATQNQSLFVAVSLVATSVGISVYVLSARGLMREVASKIILAAAVIDDVLGLIVLVVVSGIARGRINVLEIILTAGFAAGFTIVAAIWGNKLVNRLLPRFRSRLRADEAQFHVAVVLLFALAVLASSAGVAAIVGAFFAGLALADSADSRLRDLTRGVNELFMPFFLVGVGLNFSFAIFRSRSTALLAVAILAVAVLTKLVGCGLAAMPLGWQTAFRVGAGMLPRGEVAMIAAQLGLSMAILSETLYSTIVFVVVTTALATPLVLKFAFAGVAPPAGRTSDSPEYT